MLTNWMPESGYSYFHFHCRPVTLSTMSALVRVSSISITAWKAGMPISTKSMKSRIAKGTSTQNHCSAPVGPLKPAGWAPTLLRWRIIEYSMMANTTTNSKVITTMNWLCIDRVSRPMGVTGLGKFQV